MEPRWRASAAQAAVLLYALGQYQAQGDEPIPFSQAEDQLRELLREFGPPRKTSPGYPFHHLVSDGLWQVRTVNGEGSPGSDVGVLRASGAEGRPAPDLVAVLDRDTHLVATRAHPTGRELRTVAAS